MTIASLVIGKKRRKGRYFAAIIVFHAQKERFQTRKVGNIQDNQKSVDLEGYTQGTYKDLRGISFPLAPLFSLSFPWMPHSLPLSLISSFLLIQKSAYLYLLPIFSFLSFPLPGSLYLGKNMAKLFNGGFQVNLCGEKPTRTSWGPSRYLLYPDLG